MKKLILILAFLPFLGFSQGIDLELNQVLLVSEGSMVPEGKVWKITSVLVTCSFSPCSAYIIIDDLESPVQSSICVYSRLTSSGTSNQYPPVISSETPTKFPIWVPAGTNIDIGENVSGISVLEFNTVSE